MLFNSIDFAVFLPIVFFLYWFVVNKNLKIQNIFLLIVSYIFYGWWDWRFLFLIVFSTCVDYFVGLQISKTDNKQKRKGLLGISLLVNLGLLGFFKYYNFFIDSFTEAFTFLGYSIQPYRLSIILPVGISFYTFQTLSYTIDVYNKKLTPTKNFINFAAFVTFFPQLVAGPIERATHLLPQFFKARVFEYSKAVDGLKLILWGLFTKIVVADNCAIVVNDIFENYTDYSGSTLLFGAVFFAFQIYGDFSGYSSIAIGVSKLFGFDLTQNFATPYFSRDIAEFWRRWHISLTTWFRDYLYIPLGGSRGGTGMKIRNTFVIFLVSGFWHGANWTFVFWGALNALYFLPLLLSGKNRKNTNTVAEGRLLPGFKEAFQIIFTFFLTVIAWVFFRSETISKAVDFLKRMFADLISNINYENLRASYYTVFYIVILLIIEWINREHKHTLEVFLNKKTTWLRWSFYLIITILVLNSFFKAGDNQDFIYFQF